MKSSRILVAAVAVGVFVISTLTSPVGTLAAPAQRTTTPASNAATAWNQIAVTTLSGLPGPAGGTPFGAAIHVAMVQGAVYDAVNAIGHSHREPYLLEKRFPKSASLGAAVATAAYVVLRGIVSTVPNLPDATRATLLDSLATQYEDALAAIPDGRSKRQGIRAGTAAATVMLDAREDDGRFGPSPWVPNTAPGHWWPTTDPTTGQLVLDPTPWVANVDPFVARSTSQFRTPGPQDLTSAVYAEEFNRVKQVGSVNSTVRSAEQTYIARWWQSTPTASWNDVGRQLAVRNGLGIRATSRLLALQNFSGADASINCWNDKYHWDFWRPWNAIHRADEDGNPATEPDTTWAPLISAPYPEHPSGHLCLDGSHTLILQRFFGDAADGGYEITSVSALLQPTDARTRSFASFSQVLRELVRARVWAGLHFRTADIQGKWLGVKAARFAASHFSRVSHHAD